jgi:hypothetical protein
VASTVVFLTLAGCGGGSSIGGSEAGLQANAVWQQRRALASRAALTANGQVQPPEGGGFGPELPASVATVRILFEAQNGYRCCVAVDPDGITPDPDTGQRQVIVRPLPDGPGSVQIAGFPGGLAAAPPGVTERCPTDPDNVGSDCAAGILDTPSFASDPAPVVIVPGELTDAGDIPVPSVPFLIATRSSPSPGASVDSPVAVGFTVVDASVSVDPTSVMASLVPQSGGSAALDLDLTPCDDLGGNDPCSEGGALGVSGFHAASAPQALPQGSARVEIAGDEAKVGAERLPERHRELLLRGVQRLQQPDVRL